MVVKREVVEARLKELSQVLVELGKFQETGVEEIERDLSHRWVLERGLIAAAGLSLDIADHILAGGFGVYSDTSEGALRALRDQGVIPTELYERLQGLGGLRNLLVHRYQDIDPDLLLENFQKALEVFPRFAARVLEWLEGGIGSRRSD
jgi:uncharacterized protein YutE (UPF0331/DUF86 family)